MVQVAQRKVGVNQFQYYDLEVVVPIQVFIYIVMGLLIVTVLCTW